MKLLLDTHIWIWLLESPHRLGRHTAKELADPANELWLSAVSTWEVLTLHRKGRIQLPGDLADWLPLALAGIRQRAPLTHEIVLASYQLDLHQDPADRFLAATAQVLDLTLVTADQRLLGLGAIRTLANR
ncbi:MAG TPA: type II toxin-antitoxin system VapC family toxin [Candidatus Acidoferrum sp.]